MKTDTLLTALITSLKNHVAAVEEIHDLLASPWQPMDAMPEGTPADPIYVLVYCPDDDWAPLGNVHTACRYAFCDEDEVRPIGSSQTRRATGWMYPPGAPK